MSAFSPSAQFSKHWLSTPVIARQAFHQELTDIITLLKSDTPAKDFRFHHDNFDKEIASLLHIYDAGKAPAPTHDAPTLSDEQKQAITDTIYKKLSSRIDDVLSDQMAQLSEDLKAWLKNAIQEELSQAK